MLQRTTLYLSGLILSLACHVAAAQSMDAELQATAMLERLGGRATWAGLRNTVNGSQQNRTTEPTVVYAVITMDFQQPVFPLVNELAETIMRTDPGKAFYNKLACYLPPMMATHTIRDHPKANLWHIKAGIFVEFANCADIRHTGRCPA